MRASLPFRGVAIPATGEISDAEILGQTGEVDLDALSA
jgi:hypothetical protein